ncbi:MAG: transketolase C-terminal domain-containing protein [Myxococcota bacterium]
MALPNNHWAAPGDSAPPTVTSKRQRRLPFLKPAVPVYPYAQLPCHSAQQRPRANGLLRTAIRCESGAFWSTNTSTAKPITGHLSRRQLLAALRLRQPRTRGQDLALITYGALVKRSMDACNDAAKQGIDVEVLNLRTVSPLDWSSIATSIQKTGRALVVYSEDNVSWGSRRRDRPHRRGTV